MAQPTRLDVVNKLETLSDLNKEETLVAMTAWANETSDKPEKIIDDLDSYRQYARKS